MEFYAKSLITRQNVKKTENDLSIFYTRLSDIRGYDLPILNYAITLAEINCDDQILYALYLRRAHHFLYIGNYERSLKDLFETYEYSKMLKDPKYQWDVNYLIGILQANYGERGKGLRMLLDCEKYFIDGRIKNIYINLTEEDKLDFLSDIRYNISLVYYDAKDLKNSLQYIEYVGKFAREYNSSDKYIAFVGLKAAILIMQGKFEEGLKWNNEYLELKKGGDPEELSRSYTLKGMAHAGLNENNKSIQSYQTADSLFQIGGSDYFFPELTTAYLGLLNYYKAEGNALKQIEYLNKIIAFEKHNAKAERDIVNKIQKEYTIPEMLAEKERLIDDLRSANTNKETWIVIASLIAIIGMITALFEFKKRSLLRQRFERINEQFGRQQDKQESLPTVNISQKEPLSSLKVEQIKKIELGLLRFEKERLFLQPSITLKSLAEEMQTNSSYLSRYINEVKAENFSTYLNDLRIQFVINELQTSKKLRSYTVNAIAKEVGFTTSKSFTTHFKRLTGLSVSYYLKRIEKSKLIKSNLGENTDMESTKISQSLDKAG